MRPDIRSLLAGIAAAAILTATVAFGVPAPAGASTTSCAGGTCTVTFTMTGAPESWTVPAYVGGITVVVAGGAGGGSANTTAAGLGGRVTATVAVTAGDVLSVVVGAQGATGLFGGAAPVPAYGGGGTGSYRTGSFTQSQGSGGGGSFVFDTTGSTQLLVAAGGGGGTSGNATAGGNGGAGGNGTAGSEFCSGQIASGGGGTGTAGGAGGGNGSGADGNPGAGPATSASSFGVGGSGLAGSFGGGGGGGYYGGGSGGLSNTFACGYYGSGGGGSGYLISTATNVGQSTNTGNGSVVITYQEPVATTTALTASPTSASVGETVTLTATVAPPPSSGGSATFSDGATVLGTVPLSSGTAALDLADLEPGPHTFTAEFSGFTGSVPSTSSPVSVTITAPAGTSPGESPAPPSAATAPEAPPVRESIVTTGVSTSRPEHLAMLMIIFGSGFIGWSTFRRAGRSTLQPW